MNKEEVARSGEGMINKPGSRFELIEIKRYESKTLRATIQDTKKKEEFYVDAYFDGNRWKARTGVEEYSSSDVETIEQIIQNAMNDRIITECNKLGLEVMEADFTWNLFLFRRREVNNLESSVKAKIVKDIFSRSFYYQAKQDSERQTKKRTDGNYTCKNCGHSDYYYGSPLWVQKCRKCHKPIGLKEEKVIQVKTKIVNTGINRYIEFKEHLQGFQDGEILTYRKCEDGTSVIVKGSTK